MKLPFLAGVLMAWAVAQVGIGMFFLLAHAFSRRRNEYLPFAMVCFMLAIATSGIAWGHMIERPEQWLAPGTLTHAGAIAAAAVNLHFVMRYTGVARAGQIAIGMYALALAQELLLLSGNWWQADSLLVREGTLLSTRIVHVSAEPSPWALGAYAISALTAIVSQALLVRAFFSGKREALWASVGALFVLASAVNDISLVTGLLDDTVYTLPHAFMIYAAGVATTLLFRYRVAAGSLEQVQSTLRETTAELRQSHAELRVLQDELFKKQQLAVVGELAAAIAHEVRNPLAVIVNAISSLRRPNLTDTDREMLLTIVTEETARLNRLVTDLLRFARPVNVQTAMVVLPELAERTRGSAREQAVSVAVDAGAPTQIPGDANLLRVALDNLVENACHALPVGGGGVEIVVGSAEIDGRPAARVSVRDHGHGMTPEVLERAMDPFFTTRPSGTGLGLPIVQRITEAHGGRVELDSEPGRGTTVSMLLPVDHSEPNSERLA